MVVGNVEFVAQNRCGPYERNIISDGNKSAGRRVSSLESVYQISEEIA